MYDLQQLSCFKEELLRFSFKRIKNQIYAPVIGSRLLYNAQLTTIVKNFDVKV